MGDKVLWKGPCICSPLESFGALLEGYNVDIISSPAPETTLVANQPYTIRWASDRKADKFEVSLWTFEGECEVDSGISRVCGYGSKFNTISVPDTGEAQWIPGEGFQLEPRVDYMLTGHLYTGDTKRAVRTNHFAIVNKEGEAPLWQPEVEELERKYHPEEKTTKTTSSRETITSSGYFILSGLPTISPIERPSPRQSSAIQSSSALPSATATNGATMNTNGWQTAAALGMSCHGCAACFEVTTIPFRSIDFSGLNIHNHLHSSLVMSHIYLRVLSIRAGATIGRSCFSSTRKIHL